MPVYNDISEIIGIDSKKFKNHSKSWFVYS